MPLDRVCSDQSVASEIVLRDWIDTCAAGEVTREELREAFLYCSEGYAAQE